MIPRSCFAALKAIALVVLLPLLVLLPLSPAAALNLTPAALKSIARTYGFVTGQGLALGQIADTHAPLAPQVASARESFDAAFPGVEDKLEAELRIAFGGPGFMKFRRDMLDKVIEAQMKQPKSTEQALGFLADVQRRARGEGLDKDILDYLLATTYAADPAAEFVEGFRQRFRTDGSGNAQGVRVRLQLPRSWNGTDGGPSGPVYTWTSEGGNGTAAIVLDIRDARGLNPSREDIARFISQGNVRELVPGGTEIIDASPMSLETLPGFSALLTSVSEQAGLKTVAWTQMYQAFFRGKTIGVMCTAAGKAADAAKVEQSLRRMQPLCRQVAGSLVVEQLYD